MKRSDGNSILPFSSRGIFVPYRTRNVHGMLGLMFEHIAGMARAVALSWQGCLKITAIVVVILRKLD